MSIRYIRNTIQVYIVLFDSKNTCIDLPATSAMVLPVFTPLLTMQPLCTGQRKTGETRAFYPRDTLPPDELCLCVSGIIFLGDSVLLTQNQRGWEIPGGHREPGEDIEETFVREMQEEIGTDPSSITYRRRGVREVSLPRPIPNRTGGFYPPTYYLVQYIGITTRQPTQPTGEEIIGSKGFTRTEIKNSDLKVRELLLYAFKLRESFD